MSILNIQGIQTQANRIKQNIADSLQALRNKGLSSITGTETSDDLPTLIENVEVAEVCHNGTAWKFSKSDVEVVSIEYGGGIWIASCNPGLYYSYDGINWLVLHSGAPSVNVKFLHDRFMIWGSGSWLYVTDPKQGLQSVTTSLSGEEILLMIDVIHTEGKWIAYTAEGKIVCSTDGATFNYTAAIEPYCESSVSIQSIDYCNGTWIMVSSGCVYYSTDAFTWYCCTNIDTGTKMIGAFGKPSCSGTRWVIASIAKDSSNQYIGLNMYYSLDGVTWYPSSNVCSDSSSNASGNTSVLYYDGIFVAGGTSITCPLYYSTDGGFTWIECTIDGTMNTGYALKRDSIQHIGNLWYIMTLATNKRHYSTDGINWIELPVYENAKIPNSSYMDIVGYNCGVYVGHAKYLVTTANNSSTYVDVFIYSYDGINWFPITNFYCGINSDKCIKYHDGIWVAGCYNSDSSNLNIIDYGLLYSICWR